MRFLFFTLFEIFCLGGFGQKKELPKHPSILQISYTLDRYSRRLDSGRGIGADPGIGLTFLKGLKGAFDASLGVNGSFPDGLSKMPSTKKTLHLHGDLLFRSRPFLSLKPIQPFLYSGIAISKNSKKFDGSGLFGLGIQYSFKDIHLTTSGGYQTGSKNLNRHYTLSFGIASTIAKDKGHRLSPSSKTVVPVAVASDGDNDGVVDVVDECPETPGLYTFSGCPDSDGDGLQNKFDSCPNTFGYERYKGCPIPDQDGDGMNDERDSCVSVPGLFENNGCPNPDRDADGIPDSEDRCIDQPGSIEYKGCPHVTKTIVSQINKAAQSIYFSTGSFVLLPKSYPALDEIVAILQFNPALKIMIEGHTDNQGSPSFNKKLSEQRAQVVRQYIVSKGIRIDRLSASGFGASRPKSNNTSGTGKLQNRRVEFKIIKTN